MASTSRDRRFEGGLWWSGGTMRLRSVPEEGGPLPEAGAPWRRVPGWLLLPMAPVVGGAFVVALPVVGAVLVARALARAALSGGRRAAGDLAATVAAPAPRPGEAHLTGSPGEGPAAPGAGPASPADPLEEVEAAARARRDAERSGE